RQFIKFLRGLRLDVSTVKSEVDVFKYELLVDRLPVEDHDRIQCDIRHQIFQRTRIDAFALHGPGLTLGKVSFAFAYEVIVFIFVNTEEEFTIVSSDIILHRFAVRIKQRHTRVRQDLQVVVSVLEIRNTLKGVVNDFQVGIFVDEGVDVIITFAAFTVGCKEASVGAEQEDSEIIARTVHGLTQVFNYVLAIPTVDDKNVETSVSRVSIRGEIQTPIFGNIREHLISWCIDFRTQVANPCKPSARIHLGGVQVCTALCILILAVTGKVQGSSIRTKRGC